jgi:integrase
LGAQCGVQAGIAVGNDFRGADERRETASDWEMQVFSLEQAKMFLKFALPTMYGTLFAVAVTTGMRPSEYIGLKWQDIDWERRTVSVKRTLRKGPTGQWEYGETKRAGSRRLIRLQNWS